MSWTDLPRAGSQCPGRPRGLTHDEASASHARGQRPDRRESSMHSGQRPAASGQQVCRRRRRNCAPAATSGRGRWWYAIAESAAAPTSRHRRRASRAASRSHQSCQSKSTRSSTSLAVNMYSPTRLVRTRMSSTTRARATSMRPPTSSVALRGEGVRARTHTGGRFQRFILKEPSRDAGTRSAYALPPV